MNAKVSSSAATVHTEVSPDESRLNGLNTEQLVRTAVLLKNQPELARFQFRNNNQWIAGGENRSSIRDFYGAGAEDTSRSKPFVFTNGEPPVLLGDNEGANPVEFLLHALAGCITTTFVLHATARGVHINRMSTRLIGDIDLQGLLALNDDVLPGYEKIRVEVDVDADCSEEELDALLRFAEKHSPVCNTVCRPVPVEVVRAAA